MLSAELRRRIARFVSEASTEITTHDGHLVPALAEHLAPGSTVYVAHTPKASLDEVRRSKVTLVWNNDDVARIQASMYAPGIPFKYLEFPVASYGFPQADAVRDQHGRLVGISSFCGYSSNEKLMLSLATIDATHARPGTELLLTWGEPDGGSRKLHVERHQQTQVRVTVAPAPYAAAVQKMKHETLGKA